MSEFKFACPVCGQHLTADSKDTGSQVSCPTCFRKIVVPQAGSEESKLVVSASEVNKPRPTQMLGAGYDPDLRPKSAVPIGLIFLFILACAVGAALFLLRGRLFQSLPPGEMRQRNGADGSTVSSQPEFDGESLWTLDLSKTEFPPSPVSGAIHERAFTLERATLTGSNLTLRAGRSGPIELGINVYFFNHQPEELSGKSADVKPTDNVAPRVVMRWKDAERVSKTFHSGYAMKIQFGAVADGIIPGKIFLCLPDESRSWVAGTFEAQIRHPGPPKPRPAAAQQTQ